MHANDDKPGHVAARAEPVLFRQAADPAPLASLLLPIWRRRWQFLAAALLTLVAAFLVIEQLPKKYTASASILVDPRERRVTEFDAVVDALPGSSETVASQIELLTSDTVLRAVVDRLALQRSEEWNPNGGSPRRGLISRTLMWFGASADWVDTLVGAPAYEELAPAQRAELVETNIVDRVRRALNVAPAGRSFVIDIEATSRDRAMAQQMANAVAEVFIEQQLQAKQELTRQATQWLEDRLVTLRAEVAVAEQALDHARLELELRQQLDPLLVERQIDELIGMTLQATLQRVRAEAQLSQVETLLAEQGTTALSSLVQPSDLFAVNYQLTELTNTAAQLAAQYGPDNPTVQALEARIAQLEAQATDSILAIYRRDVAEATATLDLLQEQLEAARVRALDLKREFADAELALRELEREAEASRTIYETLLLRLKETEQGGFESADITLASRAILPSEQSWPNRTVFLAVALLLAAGVGLGVVGLGEALESGFRDATKLEEAFGAPCLGLIPEERNPKFRTDPATYLRNESLSPIAEALRSLAFVWRSQFGQKCHATMITSSLPEEGKSSTAIGLAYSLALAGRKVCLIDCDIRRPTVGRQLGIANSVTLQDLLAGAQVEFPKAWRHADVPLTVIPAGPPSNTRHDIGLAEWLPAFFAKLKSHFDVILADAPPILSSADSRAIAQACDTSVLVVRWRKTPRNAVTKTYREMRVANIAIGGVILSRVRTSRGAYYDYNYRARPADPAMASHGEAEEKRVG